MMDTAARLSLLRAEHAEWFAKTFGAVSAVGPAVRLALVADEFASDPRLMRLAECQMLLWDMQRSAGFSDAALAQAIRVKLAIYQSRLWPEPQEGEPREHLPAQAWG